MLLVDDILLFPFKSISWIVRQIHHAVEEEQALEEENITRELSQLYMMLETGRITEDEFDRREAEFLDRLDEIQGRSGLEKGGFDESLDDLDEEWDDDERDE